MYEQERERAVTSKNGIYEQGFDVSYQYPVAFTHDLFNPHNPLLRDILQRAGQKKHRVLTCIDSGVFSSWPQLPKMIKRFEKEHPDIIECVGEPVVITGGEASKNNPHLLHTSQQQSAFATYLSTTVRVC